MCDVDCMAIYSIRILEYFSTEISGCIINNTREISR